MSNAITETLTAGDRSRTLSARFAANRLALFSLAVIVLLLLLAAVGPDLWPLSATDQDYDAINAWPTPAHPLGADNLGRDTLARLLRGLRVSLLVAVYVETLNIVLGATLGLLAGYFGGWLDQLLSRLADMLFAFPGLLLAILVAGVFGPAITQTFGGIGRLLLVAGALSLVSWPLMARTVRSITLALREREFIEAARAVGARDRTILWRHLLPNVMGMVIVSATLDVAGVVVNEAVLSLLGLGVQPPAPSIGGMIVQSIPYLEMNWLQALFPSLALMVMVLTFSFAGDGLRDAFDPKSE
ncbi:MAG: ABC transporter permease [Anaerolineae bacterium]